MPLTARVLTIEEKCRPRPIAHADRSHYRCRDAGAVDARSVLTSPDISLHCLDLERREAIFVRVPSGTDLGAAPFLYLAQYEAAVDLVVVSFDVLHALADLAPKPGNLLLVYSVGRCGSTLLSRVLRATPGVQSLSEPDVYTQLVPARTSGVFSDDEVDALIRSCTRVICAASNDTATALKFRSFAVDLAASFARTFPAAHAVFLYRDAHSWATSSERAFGHLHRGTDDERRAGQERFAQLVPLLGHYAARKGRVLTPVEVMACHWAGLMRGAQARIAAGAPMFGLRYRDLVTDPAAALSALYAYAGLTMPADDVLDAILATDSQAGSMVDRALLDTGTHRGVDARELARTIADLESVRPEPRLTGDTVLPGTWTPGMS